MVTQSGGSKSSRKANVVPTKITQNETVADVFEEANNRDIESRVSGGVSLDNLLTDILKGGGKMKGGNIETEEKPKTIPSIPELVKEEKTVKNSTIPPKKETEEKPSIPPVISKTNEEEEEEETEELSSDEDSSVSSSSSNDEDHEDLYKKYMKQLKGGKIDVIKPFKGGSYVPQHKSMIIGGFPYVLKSKTKH